VVFLIGTLIRVTGLSSPIRSKGQPPLESTSRILAFFLIILSGMFFVVGKGLQLIFFPSSENFLIMSLIYEVYMILFEDI
jgi:hypothetical protein